MKINGVEVIGEFFAYDDCHKIYVLENQTEVEEALESDYEIYPINEIERKFRNSCGLEFISSWNLEKYYVEQFEDNVRFE